MTNRTKARLLNRWRADVSVAARARSAAADIARDRPRSQLVRTLVAHARAADTRAHAAALRLARS